MYSAVLLCAVIIVPVFAVILAHLPPSEQFLVRMLSNRVYSITNAQVQIGSFVLRPPSSIEFESVLVLTGDIKVFACDKVRLKCGVRFKWPCLYVSEIHLDKPFLHLERTADGKWRLPFTKQSHSDSRDSSNEGFPSIAPFPRLESVAGVVEGWQQGVLILTIRDLTGVLRLRWVRGPDGPELLLDLDRYGA